MSDRTVKYYTTGLRPMDWNGVMDRIEANDEWAIVHDTKENRWEVWIEGHLRDTVFTRSEAEDQCGDISGGDKSESSLDAVLKCLMNNTNKVKVLATLMKAQRSYPSYS